MLAQLMMCSHILQRMGLREGDCLIPQICYLSTEKYQDDQCLFQEKGILLLFLLINQESTLLRHVVL